jgi:hypothetical protein
MFFLYSNQVRRKIFSGLIVELRVNHFSDGSDGLKLQIFLQYTVVDGPPQALLHFSLLTLNYVQFRKNVTFNSFLFFWFCHIAFWH